MCKLDQISLCGVKAHCKHNPSMDFEHFDNPGSRNYSGNICFLVENLDKSGKEEFQCQKKSNISADKLWPLFFIQTEEIKWKTRLWNTTTKITDVWTAQNATGLMLTAEVESNWNCWPQMLYL